MELLIILVAFLLFFGAKKVPELASSLGRAVVEFRRGAREAAEGEIDKQERPEKKGGAG